MSERVEYMFDVIVEIDEGSLGYVRQCTWKNFMHEGVDGRINLFVNGKRVLANLGTRLNLIDGQLESVVVLEFLYNLMKVCNEILIGSNKEALVNITAVPYSFRIVVHDSTMTLHIIHFKNFSNTNFESIELGIFSIKQFVKAWLIAAARIREILRKENPNLNGNPYLIEFERQIDSLRAAVD